MCLREALRAAPLIEDVAPGLHLLAVGQEWDVARVPADAGFLALARLREARERIGPVLYDRPGERLYFAVPTGSRGAWADSPVRLLSKGSWLVAPNPYRCGEWFGGWCELPQDERLTAPDRLRWALEQAQINSVRQTGAGSRGRNGILRTCSS
ncbi:hypothetical protein [Streptomyces sp. RTd22]|uniref:hypothetical protein n=1 Tax=Streptomyces sp. RTd22 TaxID=1841249 RepID=UPI0009A09496|nr:hypothetical protein [Streptomyces sp. RTd22]